MADVCQQLTMQLQAAILQGKFFAATMAQLVDEQKQIAVDIVDTQTQIDANNNLQLQIAGQMNANGCNL